MKINVSKRISDLLGNFFQSKSDAGRDIEASQQEQLERDFEKFIDLEGGESFICETMHELCVESLSPETYDKWEQVCNELFRNRRNLNGTVNPVGKIGA